LSAGTPEPTARPVPAPRTVRDLRAGDRDAVVRIDGLHTGLRKPEYWSEIFERFVDRPTRRRVALGVEGDDGALVGYLLGEVRAFEFGSEACGWVFSVGVDPRHLRAGVASRLLEETLRRFRRAGITSVRTMVLRNDIPVLSFFRAAGFEGGSFVQLERNLEEGS
jgi:ribosomal protein S18 acetylase RimI-like enzyme